MRLALEQVIEIVTDTRSGGEARALPVSIYAGIKDFKVQVLAKGSWMDVSMDKVSLSMTSLKRRKKSIVQPVKKIYATVQKLRVFFFFWKKEIDTFFIIDTFSWSKVTVNTI